MVGYKYAILLLKRDVIPLWLHWCSFSPVWVIICFLDRQFQKKSIQKAYTGVFFFTSVSHYMSVSVKESLGPLAILICLFTSMSTYVFFKIESVTKSLITLATLVWHLTNVSHHMCFKITSLRESLFTMSTLAWFYISVSSHMYFKCTCFSESLATQTTLVWFFTSESSYVF